MGVWDNVEWLAAYWHTTIPHVFRTSVLCETESDIRVRVLAPMSRAIDNSHYMSASILRTGV